MISFIKRTELPNLKWKLIVLYSLYLCEAFLTLIASMDRLIPSDMSFLTYFIQSNPIPFVIKCVFPAALFFYLYYLLKSATYDVIRLTNKCLIVLLSFYFSVTFLRIMWLIGSHLFH